jgi:hypothetical protein
MGVVQEKYVIDTKGRKTDVILPLKRYQQLMEALHDLAVVAERREEDHLQFEHRLGDWEDPISEAIRIDMGDINSPFEIDIIIGI